MAVSNNSESGVRLFLMHGADPKLAKVPILGGNIGSHTGRCEMDVQGRIGIETP